MYRLEHSSPETLRIWRFLSGFHRPQVPLTIWEIGETKPRIQRWMKFLSAYNFSLPYRRGKDNANVDFLSRLPRPPTDEDISGSCALTDLDDIGVYLIRACGLVPSSCPIPGIGSVSYTHLRAHRDS